MTVSQSRMTMKLLLLVFFGCFVKLESLSSHSRLHTTWATSALSAKDLYQIRLGAVGGNGGDVVLTEAYLLSGGLAKLEREIADKEERLAVEDDKKANLSAQPGSSRRRLAIPTALPESPQQQQQDTRKQEMGGAETSAPKVAGTSNTTTRLPFLDIESIGLAGRWVERSGNFILYPPGTSDAGTQSPTPAGVIHFLGGAFVGAAPHLTYRYLLESLSDAGYVVVATPYRLDFDYVRSCDSILSKFDAIAVELAAEYGPVPVIGLGHSCGALLQVLITSLFPDAPRAANILISFNNRPAQQSIPGLDEFIGPFSELVMTEGEQGTNIRSSISGLRTLLESSLKSYADSQLSPAFLGKEVLPILRQGIEIVDQIPPLLSEIASGVREFLPTPVDTKEVCRRMYRARRTLLIKFDNDDLDESIQIEKVLREANTIMRMKRPMVEMEVELKILTGSHITPLTADIILNPPDGLPDLFAPLRTRIREKYLLTVNDVRDSVLTFLKPLEKISSDPR